MCDHSIAKLDSLGKLAYARHVAMQIRQYTMRKKRYDNLTEPPSCFFLRCSKQAQPLASSRHLFPHNSVSFITCFLLCFPSSAYLHQV